MKVAFRGRVQIRTFEERTVVRLHTSNICTSIRTGIPAVERVDLGGEPGLQGPGFPPFKAPSPGWPLREYPKRSGVVVVEMLWK